MQNAFGSGVLVGTPTIDITGTAIAATAATPTEFGLLQDISVDISFDIKELYGSYSLPVAIGRGKGKIMGKAKLAQLNGLMLNNLMFGQSFSAINLSQVKDVTGTAIPGTPYQITPTVPSSGTWLNDQGVTYTDGRPLTRVASAPAAGQYAVAAGVYTFAAADTTLVVRINYQYTSSSTIAKKITLGNNLMGYAPMFRTDLFIPYLGKSLVLTLNNCTSSKLTLATKLDDFTIPEFDFQASADTSNNIGYLSLSE